MRLSSSIPVATMMLIGTAGCSDPKPVYVDGGYVRLNANPAAPSAGYFTIHGGDAPVVLRDVATDSAVRVEMHQSMTQGGMASMKPVETIDVPAGAQIKLAPGGTHLMLWQVNPQAIADGKMTFTFTFSNGDRILADAVVQKPDGSAAAAIPDHDMNGMAGMNGMDEHSGH